MNGEAAVLANAKKSSAAFSSRPSLLFGSIMIRPFGEGSIVPDQIKEKSAPMPKSANSVRK